MTQIMAVVSACCSLMLMCVWFTSGT